MKSSFLIRILALSLGGCLFCVPAIAQGQVTGDADIKEGLPYFQARRFKEAVKSFDRAREKDPQNAFAHYALALSLSNLKRYQEAIKPLLRSLQLNPHPAWGNVTEEMVTSLLAEVERNAKLKAKTFDLTYEYDRFKNQTTVQIELGQLSFGLYLGAGYLSSGFLPSKPEFFFLRFDSSSRDWRFLEDYSRDLNLLVDGQRLRLGIMERIKDKINANTYRGSVNERLIMLVPSDQFVRIAGAKVVEMQLGAAEFRLTQKQIQALLDVVGSSSEFSPK